MDPNALAKRRWLAMTLTRVAGAAGAMFGLVLIGKAHTIGQQVLGIAIVLSALVMIAVVPRALAHRWRTPPA